jgi:hypothetical protein
MAVGASASLAARHQGSFIAGAMDADDGPDPIAVGCRDLGIAQFAGAASLADPFGDRPRLARGIGEVDIAAQSDDLTKAQFIEESAQLTITEAPKHRSRGRRGS